MVGEKYEERKEIRGKIQELSITTTRDARRATEPREVNVETKMKSEKVEIMDEKENWIFIKNRCSVKRPNEIPSESVEAPRSRINVWSIDAAT